MRTFLARTPITRSNCLRLTLHPRTSVPTKLRFISSVASRFPPPSSIFSTDKLLLLSSRNRLVASSSLKPRNFARNCSYQKMCRHHDLDASGNVDITQGKEVLPSNVKPTNYALELEPDLEKFTFEGTVGIT